MIKVSIIGASGYAGGELSRILLKHPEVSLKQATSRKFTGLAVSIVHPNLKGHTDLVFSDPKDLKPCDLLIISLPNGQSMLILDKIIKLAPKIIDLGADFRLDSAQNWLKWYKTPHHQPNYLSKFIYGVPEINRPEIKKAKYVAGPGCEAIVSILSLYPLVKNKLISLDKIIIDAKMGSSQAGSSASNSSHHPERAGVVRSYKPTLHRHTAEIEMMLTLAGKKPTVLISATAVEIVRGILVTIHTFLNKKLTDIDIWRAYRSTYKNEPFIRIIKQKTGLYRYPEPKILQGTNLCDIGFEIDESSNRLVVLGAIDNLVKGTAGNAVQCLNLMHGLDENTGLDFIGLHPI